MGCLRFASLLFQLVVISMAMTVIGFTMSVTFVFACARFICAWIQLIASRRSFPVASRSDLSILERGVQGLEPVAVAVAVANFPTKSYGDDCFSASDDAQQCPAYKNVNYCLWQVQRLPFRIPCQRYPADPALLWSLLPCNLHRYMATTAFYMSRLPAVAPWDGCRSEKCWGNASEAGENISPATEEDEAVVKTRETSMQKALQSFDSSWFPAIS
ncbi:hypothetical protein V6N13_038112 [Hibiscus sabdariffa]